MDTLLGLLILPALLTPFLLVGWFGVVVDLSWCLYINTVAGVIVGFISGRSILSRFLYTIPYAIGTTTYMFVAAIYIKYRTFLILYELIIPGLIALIPFGISFLLIEKILEKIENKPG